jgi:hypothetical protein
VPAIQIFGAHNVPLHYVANIGAAGLVPAAELPGGALLLAVITAWRVHGEPWILGYLAPAEFVLPWINTNPGLTNSLAH